MGLLKPDKSRKKKNLTHESGWVGLVCADLTIDLNESLATDLDDLLVGEGVL